MFPQSQIAYEKLRTQSPQDAFQDNQDKQTTWERSRSPSDSRTSSSYLPDLRVHLCLVLLYTSLAVLASLGSFALGQRHGSLTANQPLYYSPAEQALPLQKHTFVKDDPFHGLPDSVYVGNPSPTLDKAWKDLLRGYNMRISPSTLIKLNRTSIALADSTEDHWGSLEVFHHLHCLKLIRQALAPSYYDPARARLTDKLPGSIYPVHIEHCVERIREYLMCRPDLTIFTYNWLEGKDDEPMPNHAVQHACVDWNALEEWVDRRKFSLGDGLIERTNGSIWPDTIGNH